MSQSPWLRQLVTLLIAAASALVASPAAMARDYPNLFLAHACRSGDPAFCPGGTPDLARFEAMYIDPSSEPGEYPPAAGPYTRHDVPMCEDGTNSAACANGAGPTDPIACTDGTRPVYYTRLNPASDRWLFHIQSGGSTCGTHQTENCMDLYERKPDRLSSALGRNPDHDSLSGVYSSDADNLFRDWNVVYIRRCVGDGNMGHRTRANYKLDPGPSPDRADVYFHGWRVLRAVLEDLRGGAARIEDAAQLDFTTMSYGSAHVYLYIDYLADHFHSEFNAATDVRLVASGFVEPSLEAQYFMRFGSWPADDQFPLLPFMVEAPNSTSVCGNRPSLCSLGNCDYQDKIDSHKCKNKDVVPILGWYTFPGVYSWAPDNPWMEGVYAKFNMWGAENGMHPDWNVLDRSCLAAHRSYGVLWDPAACRDRMHVLTYHVSTPVFLTAQLGDVTVRTAAGGAYNAVNHDGDHPGLGTPWVISVYHRTDFVPAVRTQVDRIGRLADGAFGFETGPRGAFIDNTVDHTGLNARATQHRTMLDDAGTLHESQDYLMAWLNGPGEDRFCVDAEDELYISDFVPKYHYRNSPLGPTSCSTRGCDLPGPIDYPCPYSDPGYTGEPACADPYANQADSAKHVCLF